MKKIIYITLILVMLLNIVMGVVIKNEVYGASTYTQYIKSGIDEFPDSYKEYLKKLSEQHPNWNFEAYYTGISWDELVDNEVKIGKNRVIASADSKWINSSGSVESGYACASDSIINYYMDPRNFLKNDVSIFQFLEMTYTGTTQNIDGVKSILNGTFMDKSIEIEGIGEISYAEIIMKAASESKMSPYSIAIKILQEVGRDGKSNSITGTAPGYEGYYNFFNYGAYDTGNAVTNGLIYAKNHGWSNQYIAIVNGAKLLANDYMLAGQNTAYFYKWDVVGEVILEKGNTVTISSNVCFNHQYMTNIQDPTSQASSLYNTYLDNGILDAKLNFIIPVYENMSGLNKLPTSLTTNDGALYYSVGTGVYVRSGPGTDYNSVGMINTLDEVVAVLERECSVDSSGRKWDKIKTGNGIIGYAASQYLKSCEIIDEEKAIGTAVVKLTDGYLTMRSSASTSGSYVTGIDNGATIEILQKDVTNADGYTWYKVRYNGYKGYVASKFLTDVTNGSNSGEDNNEQQLKAKIDGENIIAVPDITIKDLKESLKLTNVEIRNKDEVISENDKIGSGFILKNLDDNTEKTIIVKGDINGDGYVDTGDTYIIKLVIKEIKKLENNVEVLAADVNGDGYIDTGDSFILKKQVMNVQNISL